MKRSLLSLAVTAAAVASLFGFSNSTAIVRNDAETIESLQNRLLDYRDQMNNIQLRGDAEKRDLTDDEESEINKILAHFEATEAEIDRRARIDEVNAKMSRPTGRKTTADADEDQPQNRGEHQTRAQADAPRRSSLPARPRMEDTGKGGFRSWAECLGAIVASSGRGATPDPRLIANAAPNTFGSEGVGQDGGFAVPPDFRTEIVKRVLGEDSLLSRTDQMVTSSNSVSFPTDETTPWQQSGGIQAYWESEGGLKSQSKPQLTDKMVKASKIICLVPMTDELLQDAPAMASYVNSKAPDKIDFKVNDAIINGDGIGKPLGFLNSGALVTVAKEAGQAAGSIVFANVTNMYTRMPESSRRTAVWIMNADAEAQLMTMQFPGTGTAVPAYLPPGGLSSSPYGTLMGRPVITSEAAAAMGSLGDINFVDLKQYMTLVKGGGIRQDISIHLWFDYDMTAFRFVLRVGGQPWWNNPITRPNGSSRSPFVSLAVRA